MSADAPVEVGVPEVVDDLHLLDRVDYEDAFRVDTVDTRTPEQWMRDLIEGAPAWFRLPWMHVLGRAVRARPGPLDAPGHVLGWRVLADRPNAFAVGLDRVGGPFARLVTLTPPGQVVFVTRIRLEGRDLRAMWPAIRPAHRFFAPYLLARAAR